MQNKKFFLIVFGLVVLGAAAGGAIYFSQGGLVKGQFDFGSFGSIAQTVRDAENALAAENAKTNALDTFLKLTGKWTWKYRKEINDWTSKDAKEAAEKGNSAWDAGEAALRQNPPDYLKAKIQFDVAQSEYQKLVYWQNWFNKHPETSIVKIDPKGPVISPDLMRITPLVPDSFTVTPATIYPKDYTKNFFTRINFRLYENAAGSLKVFRGNSLVKTIAKNNTQFLRSTLLEYLWNGEDEFNRTVQAGVYTVRLDVSSNRENDTAQENVTVIVPDPKPALPPPTPPAPPAPPTQPEQKKETVIITTTNNCAGFKDILLTSPACPAIQYAKQQGIFAGYPDGTFRPYDVINRAEAVKVILTAFKKTILADTGSRIYLDTEAGAWYMPYLLTGKLFDIKGFADGTFKPGQQVNKVELLKMFFNVAGRDLSNITVSEKPYPDTPINRNTSWYLKYVQFAKNYALITASQDGSFYPTAGIQRGDVAELFYRYHLAGLDK